MRKRQHQRRRTTEKTTTTSLLHSLTKRSFCWMSNAFIFSFHLKTTTIFFHTYIFYICMNVYIYMYVFLSILYEKRERLFFVVFIIWFFSWWRDVECGVFNRSSSSGNFTSFFLAFFFVVLNTIFSLSLHNIY